jgi:hypothetical protein
MVEDTEALVTTHVGTAGGRLVFGSDFELEDGDEGVATTPW